jgi:UDP-N-acetylmuramate dehydrogenase
MGRYEKVIEVLEGAGIPVRRDVPLSELTSFGIGGPADMLVLADDPAKMKKTLKTLSQEKIKVFIIGKGTNLLASDAGFRGALIRAASTRLVKIGEGKYAVGASAQLDNLVMQTAEDGYCDGESLSGIPGSFGGGVAMNAGAWGASTSEIVDDIVAFDLEGNEIKFDKSNTFAYRKFSGRGKIAIMEGVVSFTKTDEPSAIKERIRGIKNRRAENQPLSERSAGCAFKNPENDHAGRIIDVAGLKGMSVGGAYVSEKHANFIVNKGGATSDDVLKLIEIVREKIRIDFSVELEMEIIKLGFES